MDRFQFMPAKKKAENFTCIVPETAPVQKSQVLVVEILQGDFLLLLEATNVRGTDHGIIRSSRTIEINQLNCDNPGRNNINNVNIFNRSTAEYREKYTATTL